MGKLATTVTRYPISHTANELIDLRIHISRQIEGNLALEYITPTKIEFIIYVDQSSTGGWSGRLEIFRSGLSFEGLDDLKRRSFNGYLSHRLLKENPVYQIVDVRSFGSHEKGNGLALSGRAIINGIAKTLNLVLIRKDKNYIGNLVLDLSSYLDSKQLNDLNRLGFGTELKIEFQLNLSVEAILEEHGVKLQK